MITDSWQLEDYNDALDTREILKDDGTDDVDHVEVRHHWVFARYRKEHAAGLITDSDVAKTTNVIDYNVGDVRKQKTMIGRSGSPKYICVSDGRSPEANPGNYVVRRQVWEFYSAWEDAPAGWNV